MTQQEAIGSYLKSIRESRDNPKMKGRKMSRHYVSQESGLPLRIVKIIESGKNDYKFNNLLKYMQVIGLNSLDVK